MVSTLERGALRRAALLLRRAALLLRLRAASPP